MTDSFISEGQRIAYKANIEKVRKQVESEFAEKLKAADWQEKLEIARKIDQEIRRCMRKLAPPDALY